MSLIGMVTARQVGRDDAREARHADVDVDFARGHDVALLYRGARRVIDGIGDIVEGALRHELARDLDDLEHVFLDDGALGDVLLGGDDLHEVRLRLLGRFLVVAGHRKIDHEAEQDADDTCCHDPLTICDFVEELTDALHGLHLICHTAIPLLHSHLLLQSCLARQAKHFAILLYHHST